MHNTTTDIFDRLNDLGFSQRHLADMLHTNKERLKRWYNGNSIPDSNNRYLSALITLCDCIEDQQPTWDVAAWFETPLYKDAPITPINVFVRQEYEILMDLISNKITSEEALDKYRPDWRKYYQSSYEVFTAANGNLSIRHK